MLDTITLTAIDAAIDNPAALRAIYDAMPKTPITDNPTDEECALSTLRLAVITAGLFRDAPSRASLRLAVAALRRGVYPYHDPAWLARTDQDAAQARVDLEMMAQGAA